MTSKISIVFIALMSFGCFNQSQYPPPSQSEKSQTILPIPTEVRQATKSVLAITLKFNIKSGGALSFMPKKISQFETGGTGFMIKPGIIVTARHVLMESILSLKQLGMTFEVDSSGFPTSKFYNYYFIATTNVDGDSQDFDLHPIAMGKLGEHKDYLVLTAVNYPKSLKAMELGELKEFDTVYISGYIPEYSIYPDVNGEDIPVLSGMLKESFEGQVHEIINRDW